MSDFESDVIFYGCLNEYGQGFYSTNKHYINEQIKWRNENRDIEKDYQLGVKRIPKDKIGVCFNGSPELKFDNHEACSVGSVKIMRIDTNNDMGDFCYNCPHYIRNEELTKIWKNHER